MKKLFLFAALLMTGFAFYSCEDVVDNPAQDPAQSWNYSVSVKFADFDLWKIENKNLKLINYTYLFDSHFSNNDNVFHFLKGIFSFSLNVIEVQ